MFIRAFNNNKVMSEAEPQTMNSGELWVNKHENQAIFKTNNIEPSLKVPCLFYFDIEDVSYGVPSKEIWYVTRHNVLIEDSEFTLGGMEVVSNIYHSGLGIITFSDNVTNIPSNFLCNNNEVTDVYLPNSVTTINDKAFYNNPLLEKGLILCNNIVSMGKEVWSKCPQVVLCDLSYTQLTELKEGTFDSCNIQLVKMPSTMVSFNKFMRNNTTTCIIDNSLTTNIPDTLDLEDCDFVLIVCDDNLTTWQSKFPDYSDKIISLTQAINLNFV